MPPHLPGDGSNAVLLLDRLRVAPLAVEFNGAPVEARQNDELLDINVADDSR
jgi:hypothetical protein